jgi:hypothetical protein
MLYSQRGVLPRSKLELAAGVDANHPKVGSELLAPGDLYPVKLLVPHHFQESSSREAFRMRWKVHFASE